MGSRQLLDRWFGETSGRRGKRKAMPLAASGASITPTSGIGAADAKGTLFQRNATSHSLCHDGDTSYYQSLPAHEHSSVGPRVERNLAPHVRTWTEANGATFSESTGVPVLTLSGGANEHIAYSAISAQPDGVTMRHAVRLRILTGSVSSNGQLDIRLGTNVDAAETLAIGTLLSDNEWHIVTASATSDGGGAHNVRVGTGSNPFTGTIEIDDTYGPVCQVVRTNTNPSGANPVDTAVGPEFHTTANAASVTNETNATTGWSTSGLDSGAGFTVTSAETNNSSFAFSIDGDSSPSSANRIYKNIGTDFGLVAGRRYVINFDWKHTGTGGDWDCYLDSTDSGRSITVATITSADTTYISVSYAFTYAAATNTVLIFREDNGGNNGSIYVDNISVKEATTGVTRHLDTNGNTVSSGEVTIAAGVPLHPVIGFSLDNRGRRVPQFARYAHVGATEALSVGDKRIVTLANATWVNGSNGYYYTCTVAGTTADDSGSWGTTIGGTFSSGTATLECTGHYKVRSWYEHMPAAVNLISVPFHVTDASAPGSGSWTRVNNFTSQANVPSMIPGQVANKCTGTGSDTASIRQSSGTVGTTVKTGFMIIEGGTVLPDKSQIALIDVTNSNAGINRISFAWATGVVASEANPAGSSPKQFARPLGTGPNGGAVWLVVTQGVPTGTSTNTLGLFVYPNGFNTDHDSGDNTIVHAAGMIAGDNVSLIPWSGTRVVTAAAYPLANLSDAAGTLAMDLAFNLAAGDMTIAATADLFGANMLSMDTSEKLTTTDGTTAKVVTNTHSALDSIRAIVAHSTAGNEHTIAVREVGATNEDSSSITYDGGMGEATSLAICSGFPYDVGILNLQLTERHISSAQRTIKVGYDN